MKTNKKVVLLCIFLLSGFVNAQTSKTIKMENWIKVSDDEDVEILFFFERIPRKF